MLDDILINNLFQLVRKRVIPGRRCLSYSNLILHT